MKPAPTAEGPWTKERIKSVRERLGLSQAAFAEKIGVSQPLVALWEMGERTPGRYADVMALLDAEREANL